MHTMSLFTIIAAAAHTAIVNGQTIEQAATHAAPAIVKEAPDMLALLVAWKDGDDTIDAVYAAQSAIAGGLKAHLESEGVDTAIAGDIADALHDRVWQAAGLVPHVRGEAKPADGTPELKAYNKIHKRLGRIKRAILRLSLVDAIGEEAVLEQEAANTVAEDVKVSKALLADMLALVQKHGAKTTAKQFSKALASARAAVKAA
jgi:hypothetical protein